MSKYLVKVNNIENRVVSKVNVFVLSKQFVVTVPY